MTNKLTCKMSDGTEWEVTSKYETVDGSETRFFCKPIKREPREWWCVYHHNLQMHQMYKTRDIAEKHVNANLLDCDDPFLVREVVE